MLHALIPALMLAATPTDTAAGVEAPADAPHEWACEILMPEGVARDVFTTNTWPGGVVPYQFHANVNATNQDAPAPRWTRSRPCAPSGSCRARTSSTAS